MPIYEQRLFDFNEKTCEVVEVFHRCCPDLAMQSSFLKILSPGEEGALVKSIAILSFSQEHETKQLEPVVHRHVSFVIDAFRKSCTVEDLLERKDSSAIMIYAILRRLVERMISTESLANQVQGAKRWLSVYQNFMDELSKHPTLLRKPGKSQLLICAQDLFLNEEENWSRHLYDAIEAYNIHEKNKLASEKLSGSVLREQLDKIDQYLFAFLTSVKKFVPRECPSIWLEEEENKLTGTKESDRPSRASCLASIFLEDAKQKSTGPLFDKKVAEILQKLAKSPYVEQIRGLYELKKHTLLLRDDLKILDTLLKINGCFSPIIHVPTLADMLKRYDLECQTMLHIPREWLKKKCASTLAIHTPLHLLETLFSPCLESNFLMSCQKKSSFDFLGMNIGMIAQIKQQGLLHPTFIQLSQKASEQAERNEASPSHFSIFKKGINGNLAGQLMALSSISPGLGLAASASAGIGGQRE